MHRHRMKLLPMVCPFVLLRKKTGAEPVSRSFSAKRIEVYQQTPIPILGLTYGEALGCYISIEMEDHYG